MKTHIRAQELCESGGGRPGVLVSNSPYGFFGLKAAFEEEMKTHIRAQELCESGGGRPGLPVPNSPYGLCGRKATLNERLKLETDKAVVTRCLIGFKFSTSRALHCW